MIGIEMSPILEHLENALWDFEDKHDANPEFTKEGFQAAVKIFTSAMSCKNFELQEHENMDIEDRKSMGRKLGEDIRTLIKTYTNIDSFDFYK